MVPPPPNRFLHHSLATKASGAQTFLFVMCFLCLLWQTLLTFSPEPWTTIECLIFHGWTASAQ